MGGFGASWASPLDPPWRRYPKYQFPGEAVVHRAIAVRGLGLQVHDEVVVVTAYTGCGMEIGARVLTDDLEAAGFRDAGTVLTCLFCASELPGDGDRMAADGKQWSFGFLYGADPAKLAKRFSRVPSMRLMAKYLPADVEAEAALKATRSRMRPFSREFRRRLTRRLLP